MTRRRPAITIGALLGALAGLLLALCLLALVPTPAAAQTGAPAPADEPTSLPYTDDDCGAELQSACSFFTAYWHSNGNRGCDRGLKEDGGVCVNGNAPQARYSAKMDDFVDNWDAWALDNQRRQLAAGEPINWVTALAAHNGFSSTADGYSDPNQTYSLTDQLRGSVRWLDLDVYWHSGQLRLCHGVCSLTDRHYTNAIKEIGAWLDWNPQDVIMISFEDKIVGAPDTLHERINNPIQLYLDQSKTRAGAQRVYKPGDETTVCPITCANERWPSQRELLAAGKQVILLSENTRGGKYLWHSRGTEDPGYSEHPDFGAQAKKFDFDTCTLKVATKHRWQADAKAWGVVTEDRTISGAVFSYTSGLIDNLRAAKAALCNLTKISLDHAHAAEKTAGGACATARRVEQLDDPCPDPDRRIFNTIWSWAEEDRGQHGDRALLGTDKRWVSASGTSGSHRFACAKPRTGTPSTWGDPRGDTWKVTRTAGAWSEGFRACAVEFPGFVFSVPVNGWQNKQLLARIEESASEGRSVWLNYLRPGPEGTDWTVPSRPTTTTVSPPTTVSTPNSVVYDGSPRGATVKVTGSDGASLPWSTVAFYWGRNTTTYGPTTVPPTDAGDYRVRAIFPGNKDFQPSFSSDAAYTIAKRKLTVTADDKIRHVNTANPPLTGTLQGDLFLDRITATYRTDAVQSSPPGDYPISPELVDPQGRLANYDVTKTNGTMRVVVPITITAPSEGQVIELGSSVLARYSCSPLITLCLGRVPNGTPIDTKTVGEHTFTVIGFQVGPIPFSASVRYTVRDTAPNVSIRTPAEGATYAVGQGVGAAYTCTDPALVSCVGTVANGAAINTASLGDKTFRVTGTDATGNRATATHGYRVAATPGGGIAATSGDGQEAASGDSFAHPLVATVTDGSGRRLAGATVVFTAHGPATFPGGAATVSVTTNKRGEATSPALTAGPLPSPIPSLPAGVTASSIAVTGVRTVSYQLTVNRS
jgi:hypothetical protein